MLGEERVWEVEARGFPRNWLEESDWTTVLGLPKTV
jgi:hypothetical protein